MSYRKRSPLPRSAEAAGTAGQGFAWGDDAPVVRLGAEKGYGAPGVIVWVERVTHEGEEAGD